MNNGPLQQYAVVELSKYFIAGPHNSAIIQ